MCRASERQIVIDAVWLEYLRLYCRPPVIPKTDWPKGCLTEARQVSQWAGVMDEAEQDAASSLPVSLVSVPAHCGAPPPVRSLRDGSVPQPRAPQ